jgi:ribosome-binding protein aMBF1 (putative translation factor)
MSAPSSSSSTIKWDKRAPLTATVAAAKTTISRGGGNPMRTNTSSGQARMLEADLDNNNKDVSFKIAQVSRDVSVAVAQARTAAKDKDDKSMTQTALAQKAGLPVSDIKELEAGKMALARAKQVMIKVNRALGTTIKTH